MCHSSSIIKPLDSGMLFSRDREDHHKLLRGSRSTVAHCLHEPLAGLTAATHHSWYTAGVGTWPAAHCLFGRWHTTTPVNVPLKRSDNASNECSSGKQQRRTAQKWHMPVETERRNIGHFLMLSDLTGSIQVFLTVLQRLSLSLKLLVHCYIFIFFVLHYQHRAINQRLNVKLMAGCEASPQQHK